MAQTVLRTVTADQFKEDYVEESRRIRIILAIDVLKRVTDSAKRKGTPFSLELERLARKGLEVERGE